MRAAVLVPFVLPTVVVGSAFLALLGEGGPLGFLGLDQSLAAILVAHVFFNYAVVVLIVGGLWAHLDPRQEDAARVLGAGRWQTFRSVTLPALRPAIAAAAAIVFLFTFTSFGVILILGGPGYSTLETEIYRQTVQFLDLPQAAALSIVQLAAVFAVLLVAGRAQGRRALALRLRASAETSRRARTTGERAVVGLNLAVMAVLLGGPIARPRPALVRHRRRVQLRLLPRAVGAAPHEHHLRASDRSRAELGRVRVDRDGDRPRDRRTGRVRGRRPPPRRRARQAASTRCCSCRWASRR